MIKKVKIVLNFLSRVQLLGMRFKTDTFKSDVAEMLKFIRSIDTYLAFAFDSYAYLSLFCNVKPVTIAVNQLFYYNRFPSRETPLSL